MFDIIVIGTSCNLMICSIYRFADLSKEKPTLNGKKSAEFVKLSTITHIALLPLGVLGRYVTKAMVMCSHFHWETTRDCNSHANCQAMSLFIPFYKRFFLKSLCILVPPPSSLF